MHAASSCADPMDNRGHSDLRDTAEGSGHGVGLHLIMWQRLPAGQTSNCHTCF